jgi:hypothetical protein
LDLYRLAVSQFPEDRTSGRRDVAYAAGLPVPRWPDLLPAESQTRTVTIPAGTRATGKIKTVSAREAGRSRDWEVFETEFVPEHTVEVTDVVPSPYSLWTADVAAALAAYQKEART